jgi:hypothetical protein
MPRYIRGTCKTCGESLRVEIGGMSPEDAAAKLKDVRGYQCPGMHVELSTMFDGYVWDMKPFEAEAPPTDEEWVKKLQEQGLEVLDGHHGSSLAPRNLHGMRDLKHIGFGYFESDTHLYERADSPRGHRFYVERPLAKRSEG